MESCWQRIELTYRTGTCLRRTATARASSSAFSRKPCGLLRRYRDQVILNDVRRICRPSGSPLQHRGRFGFVFTPKHGSWLSLVEGFFSKMARSVLRHIQVASSQTFKQRIMAYLDARPQSCQPVVHTWSYKITLWRGSRSMETSCWKRWCPCRHADHDLPAPARWRSLLHGGAHVTVGRGDTMLQ